MKKALLSVTLFLAVFFTFFHFASAHEVYVLNQQTVHYDVTHPSPDPLSLIDQDGTRATFLVCTIVAVILVIGVFLLSISRWAERLLDPVLMKIKRYAPLVARLTLGLSLLAAAYYKALFGPELPLNAIFGHYATFIQIVLYIISICILLGLFVRSSALVALIVFIAAVIAYKSYMLNYVNYLGEIIMNLILGGGLWSLDHYFAKGGTHQFSVLKHKLEPYAFPILRILFGIAIVYASWYAKWFHSELALDTVNQYHLTNYFHFAPLFIVLGAMIIESIVGFFFILGIEIRFTALFFLLFLTLSLCFFGEVVWPHAVLFGINIAFIFHGYDRYSLEGHFFKKHTKEPVL
ncbi:MAG TPA: DoxX family protein [Candidatus Paceibacterota bacterium]|jgi:uncharacterized membrane protein YphA (DoxX/SURF4 family)|nr:DoxX family protein [Candidatus Paceibacterota bacterium]